MLELGRTILHRVEVTIVSGRLHIFSQFNLKPCLMEPFFNIFQMKLATEAKSVPQIAVPDVKGKFIVLIFVNIRNA